MENKQTPLQIEGISENIYGGFWPRLLALFLDSLIMAPIIYLFLYLNTISKYVYFYTLIPNIAFSIFYFVFLPVKYGGTPGKIIAGLNILQIDGQPIGWKEAF